jgi:hypothetical protein
MTEEPTTSPVGEPQPPTPEPKRRRWVVPTVVGVLAFFAGVGVGVAGGGSDETTTAAPTEPTATVTVTATAAPAEPTEPPAEEAPPTEEAQADDSLSDEGWTLTNLDVRDDGLGDFSAVGRVTNETGSAVEGAIFALSVLDSNGGVVATMDGSVSNVDDGETVTAEFIGVDDYQEGDWTYEFTVEGAY